MVYIMSVNCYRSNQAIRCALYNNQTEKIVIGNVGALPLSYIPEGMTGFEPATTRSQGEVTNRSLRSECKRSQCTSKFQLVMYAPEGEFKNPI
jgi:hypothetical protein